MDLGDRVSLLICAGGLGGLAYSVWMTLRDNLDQRRFRTVWIVLLAGGTDGTGRQDGPDDEGGDRGPNDGRPPRVPYRAPGFGISGSGYPVVGAAAVLVLDRRGACQKCRVAVTDAKAYARAACAMATENLLVGEPLEARIIAGGVGCQCLQRARAPGLGHTHDWPGCVGVATITVPRAAKQKADFIRKYPAYSGSSDD